MELPVSLLLLALSIVPFAISEPEVASIPSWNTISVDVAIIGLGASGAYAAVRLKEDFGFKVVVIEQQNRPGGHVATWFDPATQKPFNYGTAVYTNQPVARAFFGRFGIPLDTPQVVLTQSAPIYADFTTGAKVVYTPPSAAAVQEASDRYHQQWLKYEPILYPSNADFPNGDEIPSDLLLPWTDFAVKYNLSALSPKIFNLKGVEMEHALFIDIFKAYGSPTTDEGLQPTAGTSQPLYDKIGATLGDSVLYSTNVTFSNRLQQGIALIAQSANGVGTQINARKLLIAAPPEQLGRAALDMTDGDWDLLNSPSATLCYNGIVRHPSLPKSSVFNTLPGYAESGYSIYPDPTTLISFEYLGDAAADALHRVVVLAQSNATLAEAKGVVKSALANLISQGTLPAGNADDLEFKVFTNHGRMYQRWTVDQLQSGILGNLNNLQGSRATWFTGGYFMNYDSTMLWNSTENTVLEMVNALNGVDL